MALNDIKKTFQEFNKKRAFQWVKLFLMVFPLSFLPILYFHFIYGREEITINIPLYASVTIPTFYNFVGFGVGILTYYVLKTAVRKFKNILIPKNIKENGM